MILAAGEGRRMRPLTADKPKPLIEVSGKPLLEFHLERLVAAGFSDIVVNASYHAQQIVDYCGDGSRWGCHIEVIVEPTPLETAGGILNALPSLGDEPFAVINGDVFTDYPLERLRLHDLMADDAHLVMIPNPAHHPAGDFKLSDGRIGVGSGSRVTFSGLSVMSSALFAGLASGKSALRPRLEAAISSQRLSGELWSGLWSDVGTPERLEALENSLRDGSNPTS
jgi:MurNAc alpha-1-phosphate uridylyltransferase